MRKVCIEILPAKLSVDIAEAASEVRVAYRNTSERPCLQGDRKCPNCFIECRELHV